MSTWRSKINAALAFIKNKLAWPAKKSLDAVASGEVKKLDHKLVANLSIKKIPHWNQLRQLGKVLSPSEKRQILISLSIFIIAIIGLGLRFYYSHTYELPANGGSYTEGLIGNPRFINPLLAPNNDADRDVSQLVFSGLLKLNDQGELVPDLATSYSVSEDGKTIVFELRDGIYWHDGELLTADDVVFTIDTILDPEFKSPLRPSFGGITAEALNQNTVKFQLKEAYAPFLSSLTVGIIPRHIWYPIPAAQASLSEHMTKPIGSGPYKFKSLTKDNNTGAIKLYTLTANENYYERPPYITELSFKFYPDFLSGVEALKNQNVDGLSLLPKENRQTDQLKKVNIYNLSLPQYSAIFFNPQNNAALSDINVRQALAYAINRQVIIDQALSGEGVIINSPILPGAPGYDAELPNYNFDATKAAELLDKSNWTIKEGQTFRTNKENQELVVKLTTVDQPENAAALSLIKDNWESIGVKTELEIIPKNKIRKDVLETRNYQMLLFGQIVSANNDPYPFWHSSQNQNPGLNLSLLANKDIDRYLDEARAASDPAVQVEALKKFQTKLQESAFAIFLFNPSYSYPVNKKVKGLDTLTRINVPAERFVDITNWYIKTSRKWGQRPAEQSN